MKAKTFGRAMVAVALTVAGCGDSEPGAPTAAETQQQAAAAAVATQQRALRDKVQAFLATPGLIIETAQGTATVALKPAGRAGSSRGSAVTLIEGKPVERPMSLYFRPGDAPTVECTLRSTGGTNAATRLADEVIRFAVTATGDSLTFRDPSGRTLRVDAAANAALVGRASEAANADRALADALRAKLGAVAYLATHPRPKMVRPDGRKFPRAAIVRVPGTDEYAVVGMFADDATLTVSDTTASEFETRPTHEIRVVGGRAILAAKSTTGTIVINNADGAPVAEFLDAPGGTPNAVKITRVASADELGAESAAIDAFLATLAAKPAVFVGQLQAGGGPRLIRFELSGRDGEKLTGTFRGESMRATVPMVGHLQGAKIGHPIAITFGDLPRTVFGGDEGAGFQGVLTVRNGVPNIVSTTSNLRLAPPSDEAQQAMRQRFDAHVAAGGTFQWAIAGERRTRNEPAGFTLVANGATQFSGMTTEARREPKVAVTGVSVADVAFPALELTLDRRAYAEHPNLLLRLWVLPRGDGFVLAGYIYPFKEGYGSYVCYEPVAPEVRPAAP